MNHRARLIKELRARSFCDEILDDDELLKASENTLTRELAELSLAIEDLKEAIWESLLKLKKLNPLKLFKR